ncbi:MAG TPA: hypothetical protein VGJ84_06650 [Polyangiaceae bacterium]
MLNYKWMLTAAVFLVFLERLLRGDRKKIFLILDRQSAHEPALVQEWVDQHFD